MLFTESERKSDWIQSLKRVNKLEIVAMKDMGEAN